MERESKLTGTAANPMGVEELYFKSVQATPTMTQAEEARVAKLYRETGDRRLADKLVKANLRFVVSMALRYRRYGFSLMDLVQEGNLGLLRAVERYDPTVGCRLISYAVWWIRAFIQEYVLRNWSLVRMGTTQRQRRLFNQLLSSQRRLQAMTKCGDNWHAALGAAAGASADDVREMERRIHSRDVSLDVPMRECDGDGPCALDRMASDCEETEDEMAAAQARHLSREKVRLALQQLEERERRVISMRHLSDTGATLQSLAEEFGVSKERVRQLEARAINKLRARLSADVHVMELCAA